MNQEQKDQLNTLMDYRDSICNTIYHIDRIIKTYFPNQYSDAYQHWMPQILTALHNDVKWLPRGEVTMQDTIDRIKDDSNSSGGVSKYIQ